jgi:hypothetical protein
LEISLCYQNHLEYLLFYQCYLAYISVINTTQTIPLCYQYHLEYLSVIITIWNTSLISIFSEKPLCYQYHLEYLSDFIIAI